MRHILFLLLLFFSLNSTAQICMSYSYIDSLYNNSDVVFNITKIDTIIYNTNIQKIYITDAFGSKIYIFVDSICYISFAFFGPDDINVDSMINYLNQNYIRKNLLWYGKNNEVIDFTFTSTVDTKGIKSEKWILTNMHSLLLKY